MKTKPIKKDPDELWTSYLFRRLESEGVSMRDMCRHTYASPNCGAPTFDCWWSFELKNEAYVDFSQRCASLFSFVKKPLNKSTDVKFRLSEGIFINYDFADIYFTFEKNAVKVRLYADPFHIGKHDPSGLMRYQKYQQSKSIGDGVEVSGVYPPEGVIDDIVQYVKAVGVKEK